MAAAAPTSVTDLPVKRPRDEEDEIVKNGVSADGSVSMETDSNNNNSISAVIPGWFSEISPMWPGLFSISHESKNIIHLHKLFSYIVCFVLFIISIA